MGQNTTQHSLRKDKYASTHGGNSHFLDLFCSKCNQHLALYQKDGHGQLLRIYLDRIFAPQKLALLHSKTSNKDEIPNLKCPKCGVIIGTPMVYETEKRLAFRLIHGSFKKKKSDGIYPPNTATRSTHSSEKGGSTMKNEIKPPSPTDIEKK